MRNLKRALSLALASVMLLGMMVVGTSAAYPDVDAQDNLEAIEVLQLVGIMEGDENGNFNPDKYVTRNEMAVIMCNVLDLNVGGTSPFVDVPAWAEPYVAACYANGTIAGVSATQFNGSANVTAAQASLMLMKALGYFEFQGEFGDDWQVATIKQATLISLYDDIDAAVTAPLTRSEVAQLVLNALEADVVVTKEHGGMNVTGNGISVTEKAEYSHSKVEAKKDYRGDDGDGYQQLTEKLFGVKLKKTDVVGDDFGRPAAKWTYMGSSVTAPNSADAIYTTETASKVMYNDLGLNGTTTAAVCTDGDENVSKFVIKKGDGTTKIGGDGILIEAYKKDNGETVDVTLVVINTYLGEVTKVTAENDNGEPEITIKGGLKYETEGFEKEDMILYTKANGEMKSAKLAEIVSEVEVSKVTAKSSFVGNGETYKYNKTWTGTEAVRNFVLTASDVDKTYDLYVDNYGFVIGAELFEGNDNYAFVLKAGVDNSIYEDDNTYYAKLLLADGSVVDAEVAELNDVEAEDLKAQTVKDIAGKVVEYTVNSKDEYDLDTVKTVKGDKAKVEVKNGESKMSIDGATYYANDKTIFLLKNGDVYTAYTGHKNVPSLKAAEAKTTAVYCEKGSVATVVFVEGAAAKNADEVIFVLGSKAGDRVNDTDAGVYYQYKAVINGEIGTIDLDKEIAADTLFSAVVYDEYDVAQLSDCEKFETSAKEDTYTFTGKAAGEIEDGIVTINGESYAVSEDVEAYQIVYKKGTTTTDKIEVGSEADVEAGVLVTAIVDNGEIVTIFYYAE